MIDNKIDNELDKELAQKFEELLDEEREKCLKNNNFNVDNGLEVGDMSIYDLGKYLRVYYMGNDCRIKVHEAALKALAAACGIVICGNYPLDMNDDYVKYLPVPYFNCYAVELMKEKLDKLWFSQIGNKSNGRLNINGKFYNIVRNKYKW